LNSPFHGKVREFFVYLGPALIVSMAYMDPGNYGTAIQSGALFNYDLVWSVWLASLMAMVLQYLSGKLGIATGKSLPELIGSSLASRYQRVSYWLAAEAAAAATDLAEYLGTVIALNILFPAIPILYDAVFGALDVLIILAFATRRFRVIEYLFMLFVSIIATGFLVELYLVGPDLSLVVSRTFLPSVTSANIPFVVGIVGATVMPHALFVHSSLARDKLKDDTVEEKRRVRRLHLVECVVTLTVAALVNVGILVVAGKVLCPLYGCAGNMDINSLTVQRAASIMEALYGPVSGVIFAITLLSSGIASSTTGTLAGQAIMEGLLGTKVNRYLRRLV
jgi:manganese transport protein